MCAQAFLARPTHFVDSGVCTEYAAPSHCPILARFSSMRRGLVAWQVKLCAAPLSPRGPPSGCVMVYSRFEQVLCEPTQLVWE